MLSFQHIISMKSTEVVHILQCVTGLPNLVFALLLQHTAIWTNYISSVQQPGEAGGCALDGTALGSLQGQGPCRLLNGIHNAQQTTDVQ
jgi:hypothetical protein